MGPTWISTDAKRRWKWQEMVIEAAHNEVESDQE